MALARLLLAAANFAVCLLNISAASVSEDARDWLSGLAWAGSGTFWLWQALGGQ